MQETLARYEQQRNELVAPYFDLTCQLANLDFPPDLRALLLAVSRNQKHTDDFFSMFVGKLPVQDFFAPSNIQQIMKRRLLKQMESQCRINKTSRCISSGNLGFYRYGLANLVVEDDSTACTVGNPRCSIPLGLRGV